MQQALRYNALGETTLTRWKTALAAGRITDRARKLISMALESCEAVGPPGLQAKLHGGNLWILCQQDRLADILGCSERSVRREFSRLESAGALKRVNHEEYENVVAWAISLQRLESIPKSETPELDDIICCQPDPFAFDDAESNAEIPVSGDVSGGLSTTLSGGVSGGVSGLMIMKHEHDINQKTHEHEHVHESLRSSVLESQESHSSEESSGQKVCFGKIHPGDAKRIVRQSDATLFQQYFDDAVAAGWAKDSLDDRLRMAGLFHQVIRIGRAQNVGATIAGAWRNRDSKEKTTRGKPKALILSQEDQDFASKLLKKSNIGERKVQISSPLKVLPDMGGVEISASEMDRIRKLKAGNHAALAAMDAKK